MKRFDRIILAALALLISNNSYGAGRTIAWEDGAQCQFETKFDPAKYDEEKLKNTINVIFVDGFYKVIFPDVALGPDGRLKSNTAEFRQACERTKERAAIFRSLSFRE